MNKCIIAGAFMAMNTVVTVVAQAQTPQEVAFKVQVGAFRDQVPVELADVFIKLAAKDLNYYKDHRGINIYTVGNFKTYDEAVRLKKELMLNYGVNDAFIVAFKNGEKVPVAEVIK